MNKARLTCSVTFIRPIQSYHIRSQISQASKIKDLWDALAILIVRFLSRSTCLYIYVDLPAASFLQSYTAYMSVDKEIDHGSVNLPSKPLTKQDRDILLLHDEMKIKDKLGYD